MSEIHNVARYKNARHIWQLRTAGQFCRKFFPFSRAIVIYSMPFLVLSPLSPEEEAEENSGFPCFPCSLYGKSTTGPTPSAGFDKRSKKTKVTIPIAREKGKNLRYLTTARIFLKKISLSPMAWPTGARRRRQRKREGVGGGWARPLQQRLADRSVAAVVAEMLLKKRGAKRRSRGQDAKREEVEEAS